MKKKFLLYILLLLNCSVILAAPVSIERAKLRTGFSPRLKDYSWSELNVVLKNPDNQSRKVRLRLISDESFFSVKKTIFEYEVDIPSECSLEFVGHAMSEASDSYRVELYEKGVRTGVSDNFLVERIAGGRQKRNITAISDDTTLSLGSISQLPEFKQQMYQGTLVSKNSPSHYGLYLPFDCVIILRPDYDQLTEKQVKAIIDYVVRGGRLIFADPKGIIDAFNTPLADLLPVIPLGIRKINRSEALSSYFPHFRNWSEQGKYADFLDSVLKDNADLLLSDGAYPLFTFIRYGAGEVICSSIQLTEENLKNSGIWLDMIKFAYINPLETSSHQSIIDSLDGLTGITIPSVAEIRSMLLIFLIPAMFLIIVGYTLRKGQIAWVLLAFISITCSLWIFRQAGHRVKMDQKILLAGLESMFFADGTNVFEDFYSLYSRKDERIDLEGFKENVLLSGIPPEPGGMISGIMKQNENNESAQKKYIGGGMISEPIEVRFENSKPKIVNMLLKSNSSKKFQQIGSSYAEFSTFKPAELIFDEKGTHFQWNEFKSELKNVKFEQAYVVLPAGVFSVPLISSSEANQVNLQKLQNPPMTIEAIKKEFSPSSSVLVLLSSERTSQRLPPNYTFGTNAFSLNLYPLREKIDGDRVFSSPERTIILPADQSTRVFINDTRNFSIFSSDDADYRFKFNLPKYFSFVNVDRIEVSFDFICDSGNVSLTPVLLKPDFQQNSQQAHNSLSHTEKIQNTYVFSGEQIKGFVDTSACGIVELRARIKKKDLSIGQKNRDNIWTLKDFKISASGSRFQKSNKN